MPLKKFWNLKTFIFAFQVAFILSFMLGIFWRNPVRTEVINKNRWYYVNRGYPIAWAGVSSRSLPVDLPVIKAPFLLSRADKNSYAKIIDLSIFLPLFLAVFLIAYPIISMIAKNGWEKRTTNVVLFSLAILCIFFYFFWFPRI